MISYEEYKEIVVNKLRRDISSNPDQNSAISSGKDQSLFIVAGPGSGKTTVMVLKILKFIFVDDIAPKEILATTFTKKAANELLSRILSWGDQIKKEITSRYMDKLINGEFDFKSGNDDKTNIDNRFSSSKEVEEFIKKVNRIDFNQILTGTIDSVAEELLRIHRDAGTNQPVLIEDFVANSAMINGALFKEDRYLNESLQLYLAEVTGKESLNSKPKISNPTLMADILLRIKDRIYYDRVDYNELLTSIKPDERGKQLSLKIIGDYINELKNRNVYDFAMLETDFLKKLENGKLDVFLDGVKIILIDEYQDTNLLQESIYFKIAESAIKNGGNITVVGDDDQSLYRFRGATVDLFTKFTERVKNIGIDVEEINLKTNYRSSENIINLCNDFVEIDEKYQSARVKEKPKIIYPKNTNFDDKNTINNEESSNKKDLFNENRINLLQSNNSNNYNNNNNDNNRDNGNSKDSNKVNTNIPVLGMFRQNQEVLAKDLSQLIRKLVKGEEVKLKVKRVLTKESTDKLNSSKINDLENRKKMDFNFEKDKKVISLQLDEDFGSPSDIAFLTYSPQEKANGSYKFPYYLKKRLSNFKEPIEVFNPRGQDLQSIESVGIFCGLMLECIDPDGKIEKINKKLPKLAIRNMRRWRRLAYQYIDENPEPVSPISLKDFVTHWQTRMPYNLKKWPKKASLIELAYKLVTWIGDFQDDIEGLVYLESITQTITQTGFFNKYSANIYFDSKEHEKESIEEALWNIFVPIASGGVKIDENLFESLPPNSMNIMSIHQSKGLEFPLVIVDVGSRFKTNKASESNLRFPKKSSKNSIIEDKIRSYSSLGIDERNSKDKAFDDLTRLYFVAFSRAQDVLLLVGLNPNIDGYKTKDKHMKIPNIALGWNRDEEFIGFDEIYLI